MKNKNGEVYRENYSTEYFLNHRIVPIFGEITSELADEAVGRIYYLASKSNEDIIIWINSPGGSVSAGMMIFDAINAVECDVSTVCMGLAASMGAFLLGAGSRGKRRAMPNSEIMIHQPLSGASGQVSDLMIHMEHAAAVKKKMTEYLSVFTGRSVEEITVDTDRDHYLTAQEAAEYGLIDEVIETSLKAGQQK